MTEQRELETSFPKSSARGIAAQVVANASLLIAGLVYMGWAYDDALLSYFHLNPLDLNVSIVEYMLLSLTLFRPTIIITAVILITVTAARTWELDWTKPMKLLAGKVADRLRAGAVHPLTSKENATWRRDGQRAVTFVGTAITVAALLLAWIASYVQVDTYLVLGMFIGGPFLMTWPARDHSRGRFPYALAIVVAMACALWAASLYAHNSGSRAAQRIARGLIALPAVAVYSVQPLALSAPGVTVQRFPSSGLRYHYRYEGLRLLLTSSGTYYLLPVNWTRQVDPTYILNESNKIRIELYSGISH